MPLPSPTMTYSTTYNPADLQHSPHSSTFALDGLPPPDSNPTHKDKVGGTMATFYLESGGGGMVVPTNPATIVSGSTACCSCNFCGLGCGCYGFGCAGGCSCCGYDCTGDRRTLVVAVVVLVVLVGMILGILGGTGHLSSASQAQATPPYQASPFSSTGSSVACSAGGDCSVASEAVPSMFNPFYAPPANASSYCTNLTDATACLASLLSTWQGYTITLPANSVYTLNSQAPLVLYNNTIINGNNCTLITNGTTPIYPTYPTTSNVVTGSIPYLMTLHSNTIVANLTLASSTPAHGILLAPTASNILLSQLTFAGLATLSLPDGSFMGGTAITWAGNNSNVEVSYSTFTALGYGLLLTTPYLSNTSLHDNVFTNTRADAISIVASPLTNPLGRSTWTVDWVPSHMAVYNNIMRSVGAGVNSTQQWGFCITATGVTDVLVQGNDLSGCSWQGVRVGDASVNVRVLNNRIDSVWGNAAVGFVGTMDGVNIGRAAQITVAGNTFTAITDSCVGIAVACNLLNITTPSGAALYIPSMYQVANAITISTNLFGSWGLSGLASSAAVSGGGMPSQPDLGEVVENNAYGLPGVAAKAPLTFCSCAGTMSILDQQPWVFSNATYTYNQGCSATFFPAHDCAQPYNDDCQQLPASSSSAPSFSPSSSAGAASPTLARTATATSRAAATSAAVTPTSAVVVTPPAATSPPRMPTSAAAALATSALRPAPTSAPVLPTSAPVIPTSPLVTSAAIPSSSIFTSTVSPTSAPDAGGGGTPPFNPPWNTTADYCLNYGTNDSTLCLLALMSTPGYIRVPIPNFVYYVALHVTFYVQPLVVGPGTYFDGQNCTFVNIAPTPYLYTEQVGWIEDPLGYKNRNYEWFLFMMYVASNSVVYNVTLNSPIPSQAMEVLNSAYNIRIAYVTIMDFPGLFVNTTDALEFSIKRNGINIADNAHDIEIDHCFIYNVGYAIIMDGGYISNVHIHDNVIANVSADGICINTPAFGYEYGQVVTGNANASQPYYWTPYQATNISIHDNQISWTGWSQYGLHFGNSLDESFGFGISLAGTWNVSIERNVLYSTTWQAVHLEAKCHYTQIVDNTMDLVFGTGWWAGYINGVWASQTYWTNMTGNTFRNIPSSAIRMEPTPSSWCVPYTGYGTASQCIPYNAPDWYSSYVWIVGNHFESWGTNLKCHEFAIYAGGAAIQRVETIIADNVYDPYWGNAPGSCNQNGYIFCNCGYNVSINDASPALTGCTGNQWTDEYCILSNPTPTALTAWWSSLNVLSPAQYRPGPVVFDAASWAVNVIFPIASWVNSAPGTTYTAVQSSVAAQPRFTPSVPGQPGLYFLPGTTLNAPSIWPTQADYTLNLVFWPDAAASGIIVGNSAHSFSLISGSFYLIHNGVATAVPCSTPLISSQPAVMTMTYQHSTQVVQYWVDGTFITNTTLSADNTDASLTIGGGYTGFIFDVQMYSGVQSAADIAANSQYMIFWIYCRLFVFVTGGNCANT